MNIAIIAQNRKKELMVQFCIAYCGVLAKHEICATGTTGKMIIDATGLRVNCLLPGPTGGEQQIAARVAYNEIDLVLLFRDPMEKYEQQVEINNLLRNCDLNSIPVAPTSPRPRCSFKVWRAATWPGAKSSIRSHADSCRRAVSVA